MSKHADPQNRDAVITSQVAPLPEDNGEYTIDLVELFYRILAAWKSLTATVILFVCATLLITNFLITPMYEAKSTIYIVGNRESAINLSDLQIGAALTQDYIKVFDMWEVHEEVMSNLKLDYSYKEMQDMLTVRNDSGTRMIDIIIKRPNPQEAADIANEYARVAIDFIEDTMSTDKPNVMSVALTPTEPVSPSLTKNGILAGLIALVLGFIATTIRMVSDDKFKTADDIKKYTGLTTLAVIPINEDDVKVTNRDKKQRKRRKAKAKNRSRRSS